MGEYFFVDVGLQCFDFPSLHLHRLDKILILSKKLTNFSDSGEYNFRLKSHHNLNGRPPLLILNLPQIEQVGCPIEMDQIADPSKAKFIIVEQEVKILGLPGIIAHVECDLNETIVEITNLLFSWKVGAFPPKDAPANLLPLGKDILEVAIDGIGSCQLVVL